MGVRISIDDFGTGYSSLSYLQRLPIDELKIDRSFVQRLGHGPTGAIVGSIVDLAHAIGLSVVAEGIETEDQLALLRHLGCDLGQGFLLARPQPGPDAGRLLGLPTLAPAHP
jgi:EAL domain-containing protein (putative c-di-GMP-specific phosphodiesterase class I)